MTVDIQRVSALIAEGAAVEIVPRFGTLAEGDIHEKSGPGDLVTVADLAMERRMTPALAELLPGSVVVGEEAVAADPRVQDRIETEDWVWIIDPVDGTFNFAKGTPLFAVIVALVNKGKTVAGWIHDPMLGLTATAELGAGTWCDQVGQGSRRVTLADGNPDAPETWRGALNIKNFPEPTRSDLAARQAALKRSRSLFSAGQEYLHLLSEELDLSLYSRMKPWDHAAGVLLHQEAGGHAARLDGSAYLPNHGNGGLMMAPSREAWSAAQAYLFG